MTMCPVGGLSGMTRLPVGPIMAPEELRAVARGLMEEADAVARAHGVNLSPRIVDHAFAALVGMAEASPWAHPSLYQDLVSGGRIEIDALNGAVVRLGRSHGIATPSNAVVFAALQPYRDGPPTVPSAP
jgi:2-dehydropantoate 2-reductase